MKITTEVLDHWADTHTEEAAELVQALSVIPAPSHQEQKRAAFIRNWLEQQGVKDVSVDDALNVYVPFNCEGRSDISVYMAHTDVVFPDTEPLPIVRQEDRLCGPGVGDDSANAAQLMMCVKFLTGEKLTAHEPVLICFNSGEEGLGNLKGIRSLMARFSGRVRQVVSFDSGGNSIVVKAVGSERWRVHVATCGGHSYNAAGSPNAIAYLSDLIGKLYQQQMDLEPGHKTTYNVGTVQGGTSVNSIAQNAEMTYEYRSEDKECLDRMRAQFFKLVEQTTCPEAQVTVTLLGERPCSGNVPQAEMDALVHRFSEITLAVQNEAPSLRAGSTDVNIPLSMGIPAITCGLAISHGAHTRQEYLELASLGPGLRKGLYMITEHFSAG